MVGLELPVQDLHLEDVIVLVDHLLGELLEVLVRVEDILVGVELDEGGDAVLRGLESHHIV